MSSKKEMTEIELQAKIEKTRKELESDLLNLQELKSANTTKKEQLVGRCILNKLANFDGHYFNLTPEFLVNWLDSFATKKGDKKIVELIRADFSLPKKEEKIEKSEAKKEGSPTDIIDTEVATQGEENVTL